MNEAAAGRKEQQLRRDASMHPRPNAGKWAQGGAVGAGLLVQMLISL